MIPVTNFDELRSLVQRAEKLDPKYCGPKNHKYIQKDLERLRAIALISDLYGGFVSEAHEGLDSGILKEAHRNILMGKKVDLNSDVSKKVLNRLGTRLLNIFEKIGIVLSGIWNWRDGGFIHSYYKAKDEVIKSLVAKRFKILNEALEESQKRRIVYDLTNVKDRDSRIFSIKNGEFRHVEGYRVNLGLYEPVPNKNWYEPEPPQIAKLVDGKWVRVRPGNAY